MMGSSLIIQISFPFHLSVLFVSDEILSKGEHCLLVPREDMI